MDREQMLAPPVRANTKIVRGVEVEGAKKCLGFAGEVEDTMGSEKAAMAAETGNESLACHRMVVVRALEMQTSDWQVMAELAVVVTSVRSVGLMRPTQHPSLMRRAVEEDAASVPAEAVRTTTNRRVAVLRRAVRQESRARQSDC
jgi:hypothetical protein